MLGEDARRRLSIGFAVFSVVAIALGFFVAYQMDHRRGDASAAAAATSAAPTPQTDAQLLRTALKSGKPITLVGLGSSVGVGATLPDPATQAPVGRFGELLKAAYPKTTVNVTNLSANGTVATDGLKVYTDQARALHPTALVVAFGMNDGLPPAYNSGQTFPGATAAILGIVADAHRDGVAVILLTTPSPHTGLFDFTLPKTFPVLYPKAGGQPTPADGGPDVIQVDGAPFSARHADFNRDLRKIAEAKHCILGDAEKHWTALVVSKGEDALFDTGQVLHPNLTGHQGSYWLALDDVMASLAVG